MLPQPYIASSIGYLIQELVDPHMASGIAEKGSVTATRGHKESVLTRGLQ